MRHMYYHVVYGTMKHEAVASEMILKGPTHRIITHNMLSACVIHGTYVHSCSSH
jgi:hypothetical protein